MHSGGLFVPVRPTLAIGTVQVKPFPLWSKTMQLMNVSNEVTMTSLEMVEFINSQRDKKDALLRHSDFLAKVPKVLGDDERKFSSVYVGGNGQERPCYKFPKREACLMAMSYSYDLQAKVFDRMTELEAAAKPAIPDFSNPAAAARAWADAFEKQQAAIALANHAIATKAEIGNRREATAMNTASQAVKKATALEIQLDRSKEYASIKRMEMLYHGQKFEWRKLKATGQEMGIEPIEIFDANYGTVKAYHKDVWRETYALDIE